mgnify:CR=1 FL=1
METISSLLAEFIKVTEDCDAEHKQAYATLYAGAVIAVGIRDGLASINKPTK